MGKTDSINFRKMHCLIINVTFVCFVWTFLECKLPAVNTALTSLVLFAILSFFWYSQYRSGYVFMCLCFHVFHVLHVYHLLLSVCLHKKQTHHMNYQERMSVVKRCEGVSNCHYICILTIVETRSRLFHIRKIHLHNISTAK